MSALTRGRDGHALIAALMLWLVGQRTDAVAAAAIVIDAPNAEVKGAETLVSVNALNLATAKLALDELVSASKERLATKMGAAYALAFSSPIGFALSPAEISMRVEAREQMRRLTKAHPDYVVWSTIENRINQNERLTVFYAKLQALQLRSKSPLTLQDRLALQGELQLLNSQVMINKNTLVLNANTEALVSAAARAEARARMLTIKKASIMYSGDQQAGR